MEIMMDSNKTMDMNVLAEAVEAEGDIITFKPEDTRKIGRDYLIACSNNDKEELAHRAGIMRDASRIVIF
jgi:hypothetical protein